MSALSSCALGRPKGGWRSIGFAVLAAAWLSPVDAAVLRLPNTPYSYTVVDQDLAAAFNEFGSNLNIKVNVSPEVKGRIQGKLQEPTARAFLDRVCAQYNLEWYFDGSILYISSASESRTQLLVLNPISYGLLKSSLDALGVSDPRYPTRPAPGNGLILTWGPPRYVALVEQTLAGLVAEEEGKRGRRFTSDLTIFRGSQAAVLRDDRTQRAPGTPPISPPALVEPSNTAAPAKPIKNPR